jgi:murein DD-endopeptidase MepM/ murein hydrolase activator NlpD
MSETYKRTAKVKFQRHYFIFCILLSFCLILIGASTSAFAVVSDGFVYPVLGISQTDPTNNTVNPLSDGWSGHGLGWSDSTDPDMRGHLGQDYYLDSGCSGSSDYTVDNPVYAVSNGVVVQVVNNPNTLYGWEDNGDHGWGRVIVIKHTISPGSFDTANSMLTVNPNEANPVVVYSLYGHLRKGSILVNVGDTVRKGQEIAKIGKGGVDVSWSCSHLHFEIKNETAYNSTSSPEYCCISRYVPGVGRGYSGTDGYAPNRYKPSEFIANNSVISSGVGLVAYYPFNGNANDDSGNGNNGTVYGATLTTDRFGYANSAYSFDGIDDYVTVEETIDFKLTTWSITGWVKVNNFPNQKTMPIIGKNEDSTYKYNFVLLLDLIRE